MKHIIVKDLNTNESYYFLCEKWFAVEKEDGLIGRILPVCGDKQKKEFKYLFGEQTKQNMKDGHLWFSVLARPVQSTFTRLDRLTCGFVLLFMTMLMNILYYGIDKSPTRNGLKIGPLNITPEQIGIGVITNLVIFPPSFLLIQMFRRSLNRKAIKIKKNKAKLKFPWWVKIIAYILSFIICGISSFFIVVNGIQFGDEKVTKWLTSLFTSFFTSILITQPIQVFF